MRLFHGSVLAVAIAILVPTLHGAPPQPDPDKVIPGGGIFVAGWTGKIDAQSVNQGRTINDAKFAQEGAAMHLTTGPAGSWWNPANKASGDYTVKATFLEPKYMALNNHPHSYGIIIAGNNLGTDQQSLLYCAAYGSGTFIIRGFGPAPFQMGAPRPTPNPAVHKAAGVGEPVTQDIAWTVKGGRAECSINGTVVAGYDKADLVVPGKLTSLDGVYGIRATHNVETVITGFGMSK
jgi:hypothetical protein